MHPGIGHSSDLLTQGKDHTQIKPPQASQSVCFLLFHRDWTRTSEVQPHPLALQSYFYYRDFTQAWDRTDWFYTVLTAGLRGRNTSFFSSGFLATFSRRWDGEPSDLDDAVQFKRQKSRNTDICKSYTVPAPPPSTQLPISPCWLLSTESELQAKNGI